MRKFDLFPKVSDDSFTVRTKSGGIITLITFAFMIFIVLVESKSVVFSEIKQEAALIQNQGYDKPMKIFFNITVAYPCHLLHVRVQDVTGNHQLSFSKTITRQRLDTHLEPLEAPISDNDPKSIFSSCGDCRGGNYTKCCLTCFDVAASYKLQGKLVPNLSGVTQCEREKKVISEGETCRITADLVTTFSKGEVLISAGGEIPMPVHFKHDLTFFGDNVNLSHWIHTLRYGPSFKGLNNPLDNSRWLQRARGFSFYRYTTSIVPTLSYTEGRPIESNQYSASFSEKQIQKAVSKHHPGIAFVFDTAPIVVKMYSVKQSLGTYLTGICAILGGGFTVGGLIDSFLFKVNMKKD